jgi:hypothetical protein
MKKPNPRLTNHPSTAQRISRTNHDCRHCGLYVENGSHPETGKAACLDRHRRDYRALLAGRTPLVTSVGITAGIDADRDIAPFRPPKRRITDLTVGTRIDTERGLATIVSFLGDEVHLKWANGDDAWLACSDVSWSE